LEDSPDPYSSLATILLAAIQSISVDAIMGVLLMICLLFLSALISGSEVAFFSLTHNQVDDIRKFKKSQGNRMLALLEKPKRLLATILIANNVINIAIILLSTYVFHAFFDFSEHPIFGFIVQVILVTFLIVLLAEVLPKIIASQNPQRFALGMAAPLMGLFVFFKPLSTMLVKSTNLIDKRMAKRRPNISMNDLSQALDITADSEHH
jgi:putative hemolysin